MTLMIQVVNTPTIASTFGDTNFVYRLSNIQYAKDYYHTFMTLPTQQVQNLLTNELNKTQLFKLVTTDNDTNQAHDILNTTILALYADYRNSNHPTGVFAIQFTLLKNSNAKHPKIAINKTFRATIPLQEKTSEALVTAWNQGLTNILQQLIDAIGRS